MEGGPMEEVHVRTIIPLDDYCGFVASRDIVCNYAHEGENLIDLNEF
jgi:hypothetical protein